MSVFAKCFKERTVDGVCAVVFWPEDADFDEQAKEEYNFIYLYDSANKTKCWFCVRKEAMPADGEVTFKVAQPMIGRVIGRGGMNMRKIVRGLGKRYYIKVQEG